MRIKLFPQVLLVSALLISAAASKAQDHPRSREEAQALIASLKFEQGEIVLKNGLATLKVPEGMRFLNSHDAGVVLVKLWSNPPMPDPLGLLTPADSDLISAGSWAVIITYEEEGYVKDAEAEKINYADLLKEMQKSIRDANAERQKKGYPTMELVGWAAPPRYDKANHKLYWAKELKFSSEDENTLNYNVRVLGRRGVLVMNAVSGMSRLSEIEQSTPKILGAIDFNPGNRYADFSESAGDKVATYGIAALVAGGVAAKAGFFKAIWLFILGAKKFIVIAFVAIAAWVRKLFGKKTETPTA